MGGNPWSPAAPGRRDQASGEGPLRLRPRELFTQLFYEGGDAEQWGEDSGALLPCSSQQAFRDTVPICSVFHKER